MNFYDCKVGNHMDIDTLTKIGKLKSGKEISYASGLFIDRWNGGKNTEYRLKQIDKDGQYKYSNIINLDGANVPDSYSINQNYPNPFNPTTNISYFLAAKQFVTLKVYDILGKEIGTLVNEEKAEGQYSFNFNSGSLPSGIYFYTIHAGSFSQTRKMILLK